MHRRARTAIALFFVIGFFVTAPFVLLYTAGYRWNVRKGRVEKTGLIQTSTKPEGARIFLNGVLQKRVTPAGFKRILPDDYVVRLEKQGYFPWEKTLEVRSGETAFATEIVLMQDSLPRLRNDGSYAEAGFNASGTAFAFLRDLGELTELGIVDARTGTESLLARFGKGTYEDARMQWSPDGATLLFSGNAKGGATHAFAYPAADPEAVRSLHETFPAGKLRVRWSGDGSRITAVSPDGAFTADAAGGGFVPESLAAGVQDVDVRDRTAWVLRALPKGGDVIIEHGPIGAVDGKKQTAAFLPGTYRFLDGNGPSLLVLDETRAKLALVDPEAGTVQGTYEATGAAWYGKPRDARLLVWNDFEVTVIDTATKERTVVTRLGEALRKCAWHPEGQSVLYATDAGIFAAELDDRDHRNVYPLVRYGSLEDFAVDARDGLLRFVGAVGNRKGSYEKEL